MNPIKRYLRQATRGLWGKQRAAVWEELESDLLERIERYQMGGLTHTDAVAKAIADMGQAEVVNRGMLRVYAVPVLARSSLLALAFASVLVWVMSASLGQVMVTRNAPLPYCKQYQEIEKGCIHDMGQTWISVDNLSEVLSKQGLKIEGYTDWKRLILPNREVISFAYIDNGVQWPRFPGFSKQGQDYLEATFFLSRLSESLENPITLKGLFNPQLRIGEISLVLGNTTQTLDARQFYLHLFMMRAFKVEAVPKVGFTSSWRSNPPTQPNFKMMVQGKPGEVYAVISPGGYSQTPEGKRTDLLLICTDIVQVGADRTIEFRSRVNRLEFTDSLKIFDKPPDDNAEFIQAVLIRFTGRIDKAEKGFEIEVPEQKVVDSLR